MVTEAQITEIYRANVAPLYGYASRRCGGQRQVAEDVTQETWLRAVRQWRRKGVPENPLAWLTTVARNLILNHLRHQEGISIDIVPPAAVLAAADDGTIGDSAEIASMVNHALMRLPQNEARLLEEFHFERFRVSQLAKLYGISERAIEGRLRRARERLRRELELAQPKSEGGLI